MPDQTRNDQILRHAAALAETGGQAYGRAYVIARRAIWQSAEDCRAPNEYIDLTHPDGDDDLHIAAHKTAQRVMRWAVNAAARDLNPTAEPPD